MRFQISLTTAIAAALAMSTPASTQPVATSATEVHDAAMLDRLRNNSGVSLQWISWDYRGNVNVTEHDGLVHITGSQQERGGQGRLVLDGDVASIDRDSFTFRGRILISDTPDIGRTCDRDGTFEFRITQNRRYWRLQQMEMCDGLTDYVDIYF